MINKWAFPLIAMNLRTLNGIAAIVHDARFARDSLSYCAETREFCIECWILDRTVHRAKPFLKYFQTEEYGWKKLKLVVQFVSTAKIVFAEDVIYYEIATLRYNPKEFVLIVTTHYAVDIELEINQLSVILSETPEYRFSWSKIPENTWDKGNT